MAEGRFDFVSSRFAVSSAAQEKFAALVARRAQGKPTDIHWHLTRSTPEPPDTDTFYHLAQTLKRRGVEQMWLRSRYLTSNTQAYFIGDGDEVIEVVTFRGLRQIRKLWQHTLKQHFGGGEAKDNYVEAYKYWTRQRMGGGLLNQNSGPRSRWA